MCRFRAIDRNALSANRTRDQKRPRLDSIGNDVVLGPVQFGHALDDQAARAGAFDFCAHLFQKICKTDNSRFLPAPSITVVPSASTAAIIMLSVPRTVGPNLPRRLMTAPCNFGAKTLMLPPSTRTAAPSASKPFKCKSIVRSPMTQPPGIDTFASLHRPSSGPSTQTEARILRTTS